MYEEFSLDYDRFVDWQGRLQAELPFIEEQLGAAGAHKVLDVACGTGMHAIALAGRGFSMVGTDLSPGMINQARLNGAAAGVEVRFEVAGFGAISENVGERCVALLCLGNSLPHLLTPSDLADTLSDFANCLQPGGMALIQNRNFDRVLAQQERWMEPQYHRDGDEEWIFLRFYDFLPDDLVSFNIVTLHRQGGGAWSQRVSTTQLWPLKQEELTRMLVATGFKVRQFWGDMQGNPFDPDHSPNLVVTAQLQR
jgi:SAM-dependent methyltransferase